MENREGGGRSEIEPVRFTHLCIKGEHVGSST